MTIVLEPTDAAELLTDLSLATGYGALLVDQGTLRLTGDVALGRPREASACPGCSYPTPSACFDRWAAPEGERCLALCPGGRPFASLALTSEGSAAGRLLLGPLDPEAAKVPRRTRALLSVMDAMAAQMERLGLLTRRNDLFARLSRYITGHLTDELTGEALHRALYASESALAHAVKQETGMPLKLYVQSRRLEAARLMLLGTSMTVMQVAEKCGINDFNYFARIFKKRYGVSPSALRRRDVPVRPAPASPPSC
jgi:AraC-like DNA-binding protein